MTKFKTGDKVKLNPEIENFKYGRGDVLFNEVGIIKKIEDEEVIVDFPSLSSWCGLISEIILVRRINLLDDLQFGDILTLRNDERYVYVDGSMFGEKADYYMDYYGVKKFYNENLMYGDSDCRKYDIVKVEREGRVIYEREDVREMTVEEISKALGYEVKVVK